MKKILLTLFIVLLLVACSKSPEPTTSKEPEAEEVVDTVEEEKEIVLVEEDSKEEESAQEEDANTIVLGQPVIIDGAEVTIHEFKVVKDYEGNDILRYTYDWKNTSEETNMPMSSFSIKGFQDGVEVDYAGYSEEVNDEGSMKEVKTGGVITGAQGAIGISDIAKAMEIELEEWISWSPHTYTYTIENLEVLR